MEKNKQNKEEENVPLDAYVEKGEVVFYSKYWQYGLFSKLWIFFFFFFLWMLSWKYPNRERGCPARIFLVSGGTRMRTIYMYKKEPRQIWSLKVPGISRNGCTHSKIYTARLHISTNDRRTRTVCVTRRGSTRYRQQVIWHCYGTVTNICSELKTTAQNLSPA